VDATLISTAGPSLEQFRRPGHVVGFLPNPVDISIERGRVDLQPKTEFDVFYACGNPSRPKRVVCGEAWDMEDFITRLRGRLPGVSMTTPGMFGHRLLNGAAYQSGLLSAAIGLNISRRADDYLYSSDRIAHVMGNGLLAMIERSTGYDQLFSEDEMVFFSSFDELAEATQRFAGDPALRMRIAQAGRARYIELFNERRIAAYVVEAALGRANPADYPWPSVIG